MSNEKARHTVWLNEETWEQVDNTYRADNCHSRNEFIEKAVQFYVGYLNAEHAEAYLPETVSDVMEQKLTALGDRLGKLLFKMTVEQGMMMHIIASDTDIDLTTLDRLRTRCVKDAMRTHGTIDFADALKFQKGLV